MDRRTQPAKWALAVTAVLFLAAGCSVAQPDETPAERTQEETTTEAPGALDRILGDLDLRLAQDEGDIVDD